jgi:hypothetical protein
MKDEGLKQTGRAMLEAVARLREHIEEQLELVAKLERQGELRVLGVDPQEIEGVTLHQRPTKQKDGTSRVRMKNGDTHIVPTRLVVNTKNPNQKH